MTQVEQWIIDEISETQPEKVQNLKEMFDAYIAKTILLTNQFNKNEVDKDEVAKQLQNFLSSIKKQFIGTWCLAEKCLTVVDHLEAHIVEIGGDLKNVRSS